MEYPSETKVCQNCKSNFAIEADDFSFYEKIKVPPPTFCPECRLQRRLIIRNERNFSKRDCNLCNNPVISMYTLEKFFPVYCHTCWWGDKWEPMINDKDYDFSKPLFLQFKELLNKVPRPSLRNTNGKNSDYCNYTADAKNCYLCFGSIEVEDCLYGQPYESKYCIDTYLARESEYCYQCLDCEKLSNCSYCQECSDSYNLLYCFDCKGCHDCIGCSVLRSKGYCIFNKQYTKEEFFEQKEELLKNGHRGFDNISNEFEKVKLKNPHRFTMTLKCNVVTGNHIVSSKNSHNCFDVKRTEDSSYCIRMIDSKDSYDTNYCEYLELCCDYLGFWKVQQTKFSNTCGESSDLTYCDFCSTSSNLFACIGLRDKSYCILNRQYTKEEYEELIPKIIKHMSDMPYIDSKGREYKYGEFFPSELSPFCYNETIAQEYFPLTKEQAVEQGYRWKDKEERNYNIDIYNKDIPDNITDITDDITDKIIECAHKGECNHQCTEAFKIIPEELQFYKRMNLPLLRLCPNCRHYERLAQRNPLKLWHRKCMKEGCSNEFETSYSPERPEIVYCEKCYQQEVY